MGYLRFNYRSLTLGKYVDISIVYPTDGIACKETEHTKKAITSRESGSWANYEAGMKFQTVYLLHGGGDDDTLTYRYTNAERYAQDNRVMLVTPNIANSFGADTMYGVHYMTFITEELPTVIQSLFASSPKREDNFIVGYAMGGNVALAAALIRPDRYKCCVDISGGIGMTLDTKTFSAELEGDHFKKHFPLYNSTFGKGEDLPGSDFDIYSAAQKHKKSGAVLPKFYVVCGSEEFVRSRVEKDAQLLEELGYDVEYICAEGYDHDFHMWDKYIKIALDDLLELKRDVIKPNEGC